jgi:hypothetical protein
MGSGLIGNLFTDLAKDVITRMIRRGATPIETRSQVLSVARKAILDHFGAAVTAEPEVEEVEGRGNWLMVFCDDDYLYFVRVSSRWIFLALGNVATSVTRRR